MPACPGLEDHQMLGSEKLTDVRTLFKLWIGNFGVMLKPMDPCALDRRLDDAPEVASRIREILGGLQDLLYQSKPSNFLSHICRWANAEHQQGGEPCDCSATKTPVDHEEHSMNEEDAMMIDDAISGPSDVKQLHSLVALPCSGHYTPQTLSLLIAKRQVIDSRIFSLLSAYTEAAARGHFK